ncbi:MAG: spore germination protein [Clostridia bacterium]|nr:spore germination protein [Clostridia bacterium]
MSLWSKIKSLFTIDDYYMKETFSLGDRPAKGTGGKQDKENSQPAKEENQADSQPKGEGQDNPKKQLQPAEPQAKQQGGFVKPKKPLKVNQLPEQDGQPVVDIHSPEIYTDLGLNLTKLKARFHIPPNTDIIIREFTIPLNPPIKGALVFMEGLASRDTINSHVLLPLMLLTNLDEQGRNLNTITIVMERLLPGNQVEEKDAFDDLVQGIMAGTTMILLDGYNKGMLVETKGWEHRTVGRPNVENVVRGPQEAFVEHIRVNTALVRKRLRCDTLVTEMFKVGRLSNVDCAVLYLEGLTNPKLIEEIRRRIKAIDTDYITDTGTLEQFIEDNPASLIPGQLYTERPDRVAAHLTEGHVAIMVDGDPFVLIVPITLWSLLHAAEDAYIRWPYASLLRMVRTLAVFMTLLLPSFYISIVNYHPEMIPTDLLLAVAASRETIPFPAVWEIIFMEISFELIREASVRIPSLIGPTLGIVGAIILGQAAVQANIISPLLVIIVALTGLGSFAIPNYSMSLAMRTLRFVFLFLSSAFGFYGLAIGVFVTIIHICSQKSFGVPILSPVSPFRPPSGDIILRRPVWQQEQRPMFMRSLLLRRQPKITRPWDPASDQYKQNQDNQNQEPNGGKPNGNP